MYKVLMYKVSSDMLLPRYFRDRFKKRVLFQDGGSVLTGNTGVVK